MMSGGDDAHIQWTQVRNVDPFGVKTKGDTHKHKVALERKHVDVHEHACCGLSVPEPTPAVGH